MLNHLFIRELIKNQLFQKIANGYLMYASWFKENNETEIEK